jgi:hypothetical protein
MSYPCPSKNDVAFKITMWSKFNFDQSQAQQVILKATLFLERHNKDIGMISSITLYIYVWIFSNDGPLSYIVSD